MIQFHAYWRSTTSFRVRAALNLKGAAYEEMPVDLLEGAQRSAPFAALNPAKGVPALVLEDGTVLTQSLAILEYIEARWPQPPLLPADPVARARVSAAAQIVALDIHPVNNLKVGARLKAMGHGQKDVILWMQHWMQEGFAALEALLPAGTDFAFGSAPDLADLCITGQAYNAHRWGVDLAPYPNIARVEAACLALPAIAAAHPDQQPDAKET